MSGDAVAVADELVAQFQALSVKFNYSWTLYENLSTHFGLQSSSQQLANHRQSAEQPQSSKPLAQITIDDDDDDIVFQPRANVRPASNFDYTANVAAEDATSPAASGSNDEEDDDSVIDRARLRKYQKYQKRSRYIEQEAQLSGSEGSGDDEEEEDQDEYDYGDGFLVSDGEESDEEEEEEDGGSEGHIQDVSAGEEEEEEVQMLPALSSQTPSHSSRPPVAPTNSARIKGRAKNVTVAQPFNLSTATRCSACAAGTHGHGGGGKAGAAGGCEYAKLRDGDLDPRTGLLFIREEYEASLRGAGSAGHGHGHGHGHGQVHTPRKGAGAVPASPAQTPSGSVRHAFRNKSHRDALTASLYAEYDRRVFGGALSRSTAGGEGANGYVPAVPVEWGARLTKTAGMTYTKKGLSADGSELVYSARISLSVKVLDTPFKLAQTLLHEMCHAAAWLVDHSIRPPHGAVFHAWARRATAAYPSRAVTVCHNYEIAHKYNYVCQNEACGYTYGRHSKSIDTARQRCGACAGQGQLVLVVAGLQQGTTPAKGGEGVGSSTTPARQQSEYQRFISEERKSVVQAMPGASQPAILAECARRWNVRKAALATGASSAKAMTSPLGSGMTPVAAARAARSGLLGAGMGMGTGGGSIDLTGATPTATSRGAGISSTETVIELDREEEEEGNEENEAPGHVSPEPTYSKRKPVYKSSRVPMTSPAGRSTAAALPSDLQQQTEEEEEEEAGSGSGMLGLGIGGLMRRLSSALNLS